MEKENWSDKIKRVMREKDGGFYLMFFVVFFTGLTIFLWVLDLKNSQGFQSSRTKQDSGLSIEETGKEINQAIDDLILAWDSLDSKSELEREDDGREMDEADLEKMKERLKQRIEEKSGDDLKVPTSSLPLISEELDHSEQEIAELKLKIADLEDKLNAGN